MHRRNLISTFVTLILASTLSACGTPTRQQVGIGTGAVVGGAAGHLITGGSTAGTVGGAAVGGLVGNEMSKPKK